MHASLVRRHRRHTNFCCTLAAQENTYVYSRFFNGSLAAIHPAAHHCQCWAWNNHLIVQLALAGAAATLKRTRHRVLRYDIDTYRGCWSLTTALHRLLLGSTGRSLGYTAELPRAGRHLAAFCLLLMQSDCYWALILLLLEASSNLLVAQAMRSARPDTPGTAAHSCNPTRCLLLQ